MAGSNDITPDDGAKVVLEASTWAGTPYQLVGASSAKGTGGDCSGSTWRIYEAAGFGYDYRNTATFAAYALASGRFRKLGDNEAKQEGDILLWADHMAIYTSFGADKEHKTTQRVTNGKTWTQNNDMWTATRPGGPAYLPHKMQYFKTSAPTVYRRQR